MAGNGMPIPQEMNNFKKMFSRGLHILLFILTPLCGVLAQYKGIEDITFENYTPRSGLPSDFIETITQDKYGFIWLGTHNGLVRFDGVQFKTYTHNSADSSSLPDNDARYILGDSTGKVWIASRKGLFYYDYGKDNFIQVKGPADGQPIQFASCPILDKEGQLWFYSNAGVCRMDCRSLRISVWKISGITDFHFSLNRLYSPGKGGVWFCGNTDLYSWDPAHNIFSKQLIVNNDGFLFKGGIQDIFEESPGRLWIASLFGLYLLDTMKHTIRKYPGYAADSNINIANFSSCRPLTGDSILWCSTAARGMLLFNLHTRKFIRQFVQDNYDASSIGGSLCYHGFADRDGILWISHINGLSKLDWRSQRIKSYRIREMVDSNRMMPIRRMVPDQRHPDNYWLATWQDGVLYYDKKEGRILRRYVRAAGQRNKDDIHTSYDGIYDDNGTLWVGTGIGLCYYSREHDRFIHVRGIRASSQADTIVFRIVKDNNQRLWLGTERGLWRFNIVEKRFERPYAARYADSSLDNAQVYAIHFDRLGKLFVGTQSGLYMLDTASGKITALPRAEGNNKTEFNINYIWGLDTDKDNNVWVATRGGGLYKFNSSDGTYTDYAFGKGLTTEELRDVFVDTCQNIWISSYDGVFMLDRKTNQFTRYTPADGLDNFNISLGRWSIIHDKIYAGAPGAFSIIDPYERSVFRKPFPVWITGIKVLDHWIHFSPDVSDSMVIPVNYTENIIDIEFAGICYTAPSRLQYAYMLEGFDKDWHYSRDQRSADYNNLSGGGYTFKVKAMNADGVWSDRIASIGIFVKPAFWATWWFLLSVLAIAAGVLYWLVKRRIVHIRQESAYRQEQAEFHQKLAETEMIALRTQMNPHFIFNCMNIIDGLITDDRKEEAQDFLQKFSRLIRLVLENSQHQVILFHQDMEALTLYMELEAIRYSHSFTYKIEADPWFLEGNYRIPPLLLQPYVENAIIHGLRHKEPGEGTLFIRVKKEADHVRIVIEDNGIGRTKANELNLENGRPHQPIGMNVTGKRIDLLRMVYLYKVGVEVTDVYPGEDTGTRVTIMLPLDLEFE